MRIIVLEVVLITVGVFLAMVVNEWNNSRIHVDRANEALENISLEIAENTRLLDAIHGNNLRVLEQLNRGDEGVDSEATVVPGLQVQDTAWKTLLSTGVSEYIDFKTLTLVSQVYSLQDIYKSLGYQMVQSLMNTKILVAMQNRGGVELDDNSLYGDYIVLMVEAETALMEAYESAMKVLD